MRGKALLFSLLLVLTVGMIVAQTPTGTLQGTVVDQSGGTVAGAQVRITNTDTNEATELKTNTEGRYVQPLLKPGTYSVTVEASGFQKVREQSIKLEVGQNRSVDFTLGVSGVSQEVRVIESSAPPLDTNTSTVGQVIATRQIVDLPLNGRNPFDLAALAPGVNTTGGGSTPHIGGSRNAVNEQQIDGITNIAPENNVGINNSVYTPQVDAVQEFSVQINNLSAEYGRFGGGVINVVTKSGTNQLHGTLYEFARNSALDANDFFANRAGADKGDFKRNQFGGTVGGPVVLPKLYDGHNRTFFFFGYEGTREEALAVAQRTVPLQAWKTGDFSSLLPNTLIYDPLTVRPDPANPSRLIRDPFPGNIIPANRIDPVAAKAVQFFPNPNTGAPGAISNNFINVGTTNNNGNRWDSKVDHNLSNTWRTFLRLSHSWGDGAPLQDYGNIASQGWDGPSNNGAWSAALDNTITLSPTLLLNFRYGLSRSTYSRLPFSAGFDLTSLGYSSAIANVLAQRGQQCPRLEFSSGDGLGANGWNYLIQNPLVHDFTASATKIAKGHTLKFGGEYRKLFLNFTQYGRPSGYYYFDSGWTQQVVNNANGSGNAYASFLLGLPNNGTFTHEPTAASSSQYFALYLQDDWKVTRKLTLNLGLRWDVDVPRTERYDQLSYWDPNAPSPLQGQVPASACPACGSLKGAMRFVGDDGAYGRHQGPTQWKGFGPRVGFAYNATSRMVLRGGYGIAYMPSALQAAGTSGASGMQGFNRNTNITTSFDNQRTIAATLSNPVPAGFNLPIGTAAGAATDLGADINESFFNSYRTPYSQQWNVNIQHQLPASMVVEVGYIGNRGLFLIDGDPGQTYNQVDPSYLSLGNRLYDQVANPFYGLVNVPGSPLSQPTIQYRYLLRPYPQYTGVTAFRKPGASSIYHAVTVRLEKRFSHGLQFSSVFTGGKTMDNSASAVGFLGPSGNGGLNQYNRRLDWAISPQDVSHRLVTSFVYELPFGRGRHWLSNSSRMVNLLIGGWQANGIVTWQSGTPLIVSGSSNETGLFSGQRVNNNGQSAAINSPSINGWFNTAVFSQPSPLTFGTAPRTLPDVRTPGLANSDLSFFKNNTFGRDERFNVQYRLEMFNALNHAQFAGPDTNIQSGGFGTINSTAVAPRQIQMALKFIF